MNKTLATMITNVQNEVQDTTTTIQPIITNFLNRRMSQILRAINWESYRTDYTFDTVAGTSEYLLPDDFGKPLSVRDSTNGIELPEMDLQALISQNITTFGQSGTVEKYSIVEDRVQKQPTSSSVIAIVSSSASDTTQVILVRGVSGGSEVYESVSLNGTTTANTTNSYTRIISISKSAVTAGRVTATSNSGAITIVTIAPVITTPFFKKIRLHAVPTSVITIAAPYIIKPAPMVSDYDYPIIDIADGIELGAIADTWRYKRQFAKAGVFEGMFASFLNDYIWEQENKPNQVQQFTPSTYNPDGLY